MFSTLTEGFSSSSSSSALTSVIFRFPKVEDVNEEDPGMKCDEAWDDAAVSLSGVGSRGAIPMALSMSKGTFRIKEGD